jgi:hypothetical protein
LRLAGFVHEVDLGEGACVSLSIPFRVKQRFADLIKITPALLRAAQQGGGQVDLDDEALADTMAALKPSKVVEIVFEEGCIVGWQGIEAENRERPGEFVELPYAPENLAVLRDQLDWKSLTLIANEAQRIAQGN